MKTHIIFALFLCSSVLVFSQNCFSPEFGKAYDNYIVVKEKWNKENHSVSNTAQINFLSDNLLASLNECSKVATTLTDCIAVLVEINHGPLAGYTEDNKDRLQRHSQQMDLMILKVLKEPALIMACNKLNQEVGIQMTINAMAIPEFQLKFKQSLYNYPSEMIVFILWTLDKIDNSPFDQKELDLASSKINKGSCSKLTRLFDQITTFY